MTDTPHDSTPARIKTASGNTRRSRIGLALGSFALLTALSPALYILYNLVMMWWELARMAPPPESIRPMGFVWAAFLASVFGYVICSPFCFLCGWIAGRLGSEVGSSLAYFGVLAGGAPIMIAFFGVPLMCGFTGVGLGS